MKRVRVICSCCHRKRVGGHCNLILSAHCRSCCRDLAQRDHKWKPIKPKSKRHK